jgi:hypothetical protein
MIPGMSRCSGLQLRPTKTGRNCLQISYFYRVDRDFAKLQLKLKEFRSWSRLDRNARPSGPETESPASPYRAGWTTAFQFARSDSNSYSMVKAILILCVFHFVLFCCISGGVFQSINSRKNSELYLLQLFLCALQAIFAVTSGTSDILSPIRAPRRWAATLLVGFLGLVLFGCLMASLAEFISFEVVLFNPYHDTTAFYVAVHARQGFYFNVLMIPFVPAYIYWLVFLIRYSPRWNRGDFYKNTIQHLLAGSLVELIISIFCYRVVSGDWTNYHYFDSSESGIVMGVAVIGFVIGPGVIWLMMQRALPKLENVPNQES